MSLTFNPLKKGKTLLLFDVDGTLTKSRLSIEQPMFDCLTEISKHENIELASVGGSDAKKAQEQLKDSIPLFKYLFTENGVVTYDSSWKIVHSKTFVGQIGEENMKKIINFCLRYIADLDIPVKRGTFVEFRKGMLNVSPIGRNCSQEERMAFVEYTKEHKIIEKFREELIKNFAQEMNIQVSIGGQISFDVFPVGWNKTYCLQVLKEFGLTYDNIIFFGDKTNEGGNDHEIAISKEITRGYQVKDPDDTIVKLKELVKEIDELK